MFADVIVVLCFAVFAAGIGLQWASFHRREGRRERRSMPTGQRLARRRHQRGFEHDLLVERQSRRAVGDVEAA